MPPPTAPRLLRCLATAHKYKNAADACSNTFRKPDKSRTKSLVQPKHSSPSVCVFQRACLIGDMGAFGLSNSGCLYQSRQVCTASQSRRKWMNTHTPPCFCIASTYKSSRCLLSSFFYENHFQLCIIHIIPKESNV